MWWDKYIGIPFKEKGRGVEGLDCWGLTRLVYAQELGVILPSYDEKYLNTLDNASVGSTVSEVRQGWVDVTEPKEFDVVILRVMNMPMHIGVVTKDKKMIHCSHDIGVVHENLDSMRWKNRIIGYCRYE